MSDIPAEAVEAAARAIFGPDYPYPTEGISSDALIWEDLSEEFRNDYRSQARAALEAAMPLLIAAEQNAP